MLKLLQRFLAPPVDAAGTIPRRRLIHVLTLGFVVIGLLLALSFAAYAAMDAATRAVSLQALATVVVGTVLLVGLLVLNHYRSDHWAGIGLTLLIIASLSFADTPNQLIDGRSLLLFLLPIFVSSVVVSPASGFWVAAVSGLINILLWVADGPKYNIPLPNFPGIVTYFAFALVSWLAANSLERALKDLFKLNRELDQRVADRTRQLAEALAKNQAILDSAGDGLIVLDAQGKAVTANPALSRLLECPVEQILGQDLNSLMNAGGEVVNAADREKVLAGLRALDPAQPSVRLGWGNRTLSVNFAAMQNSIGGAVAAFRDVSYETELERLKDRFVASVSHELRTPLGSILAYSEMLQQQAAGALTARQAEIASALVINARRLLWSINDLLDRAQLEAGRLKLQAEPFAPRQVLAEVEQVALSLANRRKLRLMVEMAPDMPAVLLGDEKRLGQVLINLTTNAIKFTDAGGTVGVRLYQLDAEHYAIQVSDSGAGIPPEEQAKIFEPFQRGSTLATQRQSGTGLGLSIVKDLVLLMGGEIKLESEIGQGSVFTVTLPLIQAGEALKAAFAAQQ
jgi:signal transduction histidine kinase